ncbi:MAG TPA: dienelactone hydrolase family protein [Tepidisphaeraceae bacterium]|jgi:dienelactone hydrolase
MFAHATIKSEPIEYRQGNTTFEGVLFYDDADSAPRRAILVCHEWWGLNEYSKKRAEQLAQMGYVAFAVDVYGKGVQARTMDEARQMATALRNDRATMRARINAALAALRARKEVDPKKVAAIGYCFGGTVALELARSGADVLGIVSFHGGLATPNPADAKNIKGQVLVCHGADDPNVPMSEVNAFIDEMKAAKVNYQVNLYGGAVHTFTNPAAGNDPSKGSAYNEQADRRSWEEMKMFFNEVFR